MTALKFVLLIIGGYLLGCFSSAKFLSHLKKDDITKHGSGNPGTMNMLRTYGFKFGALTLLMDALKGAIPSLVGFFMFGGTSGGNVAYIGLFVGGFSAILGHIFPVFSKFKGGKGVACIVGMFAVAEPLWAFCVLLGCFLYLLIFKYGVLASFIFITVLTIVEAYRFRGDIIICLILFGVFCCIWFMHRQNFFRLLIGKENKVNIFKRKKKTQETKPTKQERKEIKEENKIKEIG